ncbi:hypothetical protein B0H11DRAFT_2069107 [Mycena galericulata]|nr:hypothetical protein B0H11DRAFT_2069107 [Mycena galericulata]
MPHIPQELVSATVGYLTDEQDLRQCALVCREWQYPAQTFIFQTISLGVGVQDGFAPGLIDMPPLGECDPQGLYSCLHNLLLEAPRIASFIQTLNLGLCPLQSDTLPNALSMESWHDIEDMIIRFLPSLKGLQTIGLFPCGPGLHNYQVSPRIKNVLGSLSPNSVIFSSWCLSDISVLSSFKLNSQTVLKFIQCRFETPSSYLPPIIRVSDIHIDHCHGLASFSTHWTPWQRQCTQTMSVNVSYRTESAMMVSEELSSLAASVSHTLTIGIDSIRSDSPALFSLATFAHLQILHLSFSDDFSDFGASFSRSMSMAWLERTFTTILLPKYTVLRLTVTTGSFWSDRDPDWETILDATLRRNFTLRIHNHTSQGNDSISGGRVVNYTFLSNIS